MSPISSPMDPAINPLGGVFLSPHSNNRIAADYMIMSIPSLLIFKEGKVVDTIRGAVPKETIQKHIDKAI